MVTLTAPETIVVGQPFDISFSATERVAGRLRLTVGTEAVEFLLEREGREPARAAGHRLRGRELKARISDWGEHEVGAELVLRFEPRKVWMKVVAG